MSVKKILFLTALAVTTISTTEVMANSFRQESAINNSSASKVYVEGQLGYARQNYFDNENWFGAQSSTAVGAIGTGFNSHGNVRGGFSAGVDTGYKINKNFAIELGWFHLPSVNVMQSGSPGQTPAYLTSWVLYFAGKYMMPLPWINSINMFFKLGAAYRSATLPLVAQTGYGVSTGKSTFIRPMFATGLDYNFNHNILGIVQYAYFMGANNSFPSTTPNAGALGTVAANVFTLGLGYQFNV